MNFPFFIARRYLLSKKSQRAINIISWISVSGVTIGTCALIVVLSVFNGLEELVSSLYNTFDPELKITAAEGKTFDLKNFPLEELRRIKGVHYVAQALEENALLKYRDNQVAATVKGVSDEFLEMTRMDTTIREGKLVLHEGNADFAVIGGGVAYRLRLNISDFLSQLEVFVPRRNVPTSINPEDALNHPLIMPSGIYSLQQDIDSKYVLVPISFARDLLEYDSTMVSSLELNLTPGANADKVQNEIKQLVGNTYEVKNRFEQHELMNRVMKSEKWAVYLILTLILLIATFNIVGSLTMLIIDKQKDIAILHSMGADRGVISRIFLSEGLLITLTGAFIGLLLGAGLCIAQQRYGFVRLEGEGSFVVDAYPVSMHVLDFIYVFLTVFTIGFLASLYPAQRLVKKRLSLRLSAQE